MSQKRSEDQRAETYARALFDSARAAGRTGDDLAEWSEAEDFSPEVLKTLLTLGLDQDTNLISEVARRYQELAESNDKTLAVKVTTAVPLDDELRSKISSTLESKLGEPVYLFERVDPAILGGIIVEVAGKRYDGSVKTQLADIRQTLLNVYSGGDE